MENKVIENLVEKAIEARNMAYAPYSGFKVGAALLDASGGIHLGCNIENAALTPGNCAERTAFFTSIAQGKRQFSAIAIVGGADNLVDDCFPCGVCRQVMMEFCGEGFQIIIAQNPQNYRIFTLPQLLPHGFGPGHISPK
ncbi:MAG: cytidine deaminase [Defluviitaleaceae bacterium]|nr:cytidine deaminase [Defluviitaleaceae bacterium]